GQANAPEGIRAVINRSSFALAPQRAHARPHPESLRWHRENCFKQSIEVAVLLVRLLRAPNTKNPRPSIDLPSVGRAMKTADPRLRERSQQCLPSPKTHRTSAFQSKG